MRTLFCYTLTQAFVDTPWWFEFFSTFERFYTCPSDGRAVSVEQIHEREQSDLSLLHCLIHHEQYVRPKNEPGMSPRGVSQKIRLLHSQSTCARYTVGEFVCTVPPLGSLAPSVVGSVCVRACVLPSPTVLCFFAPENAVVVACEKQPSSDGSSTIRSSACPCLVLGSASTNMCIRQWFGFDPSHGMEFVESLCL